MNMLNLKPIRIAIVDDQLLVRTGIAKLLSEFRNQIEIVFEAENGQEFLDKLISHPIDIVLLDIEMPITQEVYKTLFEGKNVRAAARDLMSRESKPEWW